MGLQDGITAGDEPSPRPCQFLFSMGALEPGQGCTALIWLLGTDCRYLCRWCLGGTKRLNPITISTLGCLTDHKLIMSLFHASVSPSDKRIVACFKGDLQTESYCLRNQASRMELRRKNQLGCLFNRGQLWYLSKAEPKGGVVSEIAYTCR